jgi:cytochrome c-type biogenesis protein
MVGFRAAYAVGSLACALPFFLAGIAGTFTRLGMFAGMAIFVAYANGMGPFFTGLGLFASHVSGAAVKLLRLASRLLPMVANAPKLLIGVDLVCCWVTNFGNWSGHVGVGSQG